MISDTAADRVLRQRFVTNLDIIPEVNSSTIPYLKLAIFSKSRRGMVIIFNG
jgi:hypothetical protein